MSFGIDPADSALEIYEKPFLAGLTKEDARKESLRRKGSWAVFRQDDTGNQYMVKDDLTRDESERLAAEMEASGHKQTYWVQQRRKGAN